jgi:hypothetical protein
VESSCELGNEPSGSIKCWESAKWLHNLLPIEWYLASQSQLVSYVNSYVILIYGMYCLYSSPIVLSIYSLDDDDYLMMYVNFLLLFY